MIRKDELWMALCWRCLGGVSISLSSIQIGIGQYGEGSPIELALTQACGYIASMSRPSFADYVN